MELYPHQIQGLKETEDLDHVAYYWDMGTGKTYVGAEKMLELGAFMNLVICQKSKINDWMEHFIQNYPYDFNPCDLRKVKEEDLKDFIRVSKDSVPVPSVYIINYELVWRRPELMKLEDFTLLLDESSLIQNETAKRSKFILKMHPKNVILLSGTPTGGKYENLWSQMRLLGWKISKQTYWNQYIDVEYLDTVGRSIPIVKGYKKVDRLKRKMAEHGCRFLKTDEVMDLPAQTFTKVWSPASKDYRIFRKQRYVCLTSDIKETETKDGITYSQSGTELVGDTTLTKMLYERQLCGQYNKEKLQAFADLLESTNDRLIVFYNFYAEMDHMIDIAGKLNRPISVVNGSIKALKNYEECDDSVTFIQYQAGAMGLNLQKANKIIYFTLPLSSELFEQSKKRIHRIGQERPCFYYLMLCRGSIEEKILQTLEMRQDYTEALFEKEEINEG